MQVYSRRRHPKIEGMSARHSGLQIDVLNLYRALLRCCGTDSNLKKTVSLQFRQKAMSMKRTDIKMIEHSIRYGYKQIKVMQMPSFKAARVV